MKRSKLLLGIGASLCVIALFGSCGKKAAKSVDLNSVSLDKIISEAKKEGRVESVGMPDAWANWGETWAGIKSKYGIEHADLDMSSAEEISMFEAEANAPTKDIGDIGAAMCATAMEKGVTQAYKTSQWEKIPAWAKDPDGNWVIGYYGTISFLTNTKLVKNPPKSWQDVLKGDYKLTIGDVVKASQAQATVASAALAFGGSLDNIQPGIDFFKKLGEQGRLDKGDLSLARIQKGEIAVAVQWDYNSLGDRAQAIAADPTMSFVANIPVDGALQLGYATIINKHAPHPYAAALAREYILSDEGQINLAKGFASPIRSDVAIPADIQAKLIDRAEYGKAQPITDFAVWAKSITELSQKWQDDVVPVMK